MRTACLALLLLLPTVALADEPAKDERKIVRVKTAAELLRAIAPATIVEIEPGDYEVTEVKPFESHWIKFVTAARGVDAGRQNIGNEVMIQRVSGLTLRPTDPKNPPRLLARPRFALVFDITDSNRVVLENLILGHTHEGICSAGVVGVTNSTAVTLDRCKLFGCGYEGFIFKDSVNLLVKRCRIYECKGALAEIFACRDVRIEDTSFDHNTDIYDGIRIRRSHGVVFDRCVITDNTTQVGGRNTLFDVDDKSTTVRVRNAILRNNKFRQITNDPEKVLVESAA